MIKLLNFKKKYQQFKICVLKDINNKDFATAKKSIEEFKKYNAHYLAGQASYFSEYKNSQFNKEIISKLEIAIKSCLEMKEFDKLHDLYETLMLAKQLNSNFEKEIHSIIFGQIVPDLANLEKVIDSEFAKNSIKAN